MPHVPDDYLSLSAAARTAGVSRRTVYNWMQQGKLTWRRLPSGRRRIRRGDLLRENLIQAATAASRHGPPGGSDA